MAEKIAKISKKTLASRREPKNKNIRSTIMSSSTRPAKILTVGRKVDWSKADKIAKNTATTHI